MKLLAATLLLLATPVLAADPIVLQGTVGTVDARDRVMTVVVGVPAPRAALSATAVAQPASPALVAEATAAAGTRATTLVVSWTKDTSIQRAAPSEAGQPVLEPSATPPAAGDALTLTAVRSDDGTYVASSVVIAAR